MLLSSRTFGELVDIVCLEWARTGAELGSGGYYAQPSLPEGAITTARQQQSSLIVLGLN
jgi:hypothetical protein